MISSTQYGTQMRRDKTGRSMDNLLYSQKDIEEESENSRLKQILNMYGLDRINEQQPQSRTEMQNRYHKSENHSPPARDNQSSMVATGIHF